MGKYSTGVMENRTDLNLEEVGFFDTDHLSYPESLTLFIEWLRILILMAQH